MQYVTVTGSVAVSTSRKVLKGFSLSGTSAAVIEVRDGGASGTIVLKLNVGTNESVLASNLNLPFNDDIYVNIVSGTVVGSFWVE